MFIFTPIVPGPVTIRLTIDTAAITLEVQDAGLALEYPKHSNQEMCPIRSCAASDWAGCGSDCGNSWGQLTILSSPNGTCVRATVPVPKIETAAPEAPLVA